MNKIINKVLLAGDKFFEELYLRQPSYTCSACGTITKHRKRIQNFKVAGDLKPIYKSELDTFFTDDEAYRNDLTKRTTSHKILKGKAYEVAINPKYDANQRGLASMMYKIVDKKIRLRASVNEELAQELYKLMIQILERRKIYSRFKYISWAADLAEMGSLFSLNRGVNNLLVIIDVFIKHTWGKPLEDKTGKTVLHGFVEIAKESKRKPYQIMG